MPVFADLVRRLLDTGSVSLREPPRLRAEERPAVQELLAAAYADYRLDIAGPPIAFAADVAALAVEWLAWSCWFLLHRGDTPTEVARCLPVLPVSRSASEHLSGD